MKKLLFIFLLISVNSLLSQKNTPIKTIGYSQVILSENFDPWEVNLQNKEMPNPNGASEKDRLLKLKNELSKKYGRKKLNPQIKSNSDTAIQIIVEKWV